MVDLAESGDSCHVLKIQLRLCELRVHAGRVRRMVYRYVLVPVPVYDAYQVRRTRWYKRKCTQVFGDKLLGTRGGEIAVLMEGFKLLLLFIPGTWYSINCYQVCITSDSPPVFCSVGRGGYAHPPL